jgi:UDP-GlcNAc:undecaprenyl-phosphate GlcNAc-1-phosphate transferase
VFLLLLITLFSFGCSLILTPLCRDLFHRIGVLDRPDHARKTHTSPIPHMGGVPIMASYLLSCLMIHLFNPAAALRWPFDYSIFVRLAPAVAVVFLTGVLDDVVQLKPWHKLGGQVIAAGWAYWAGIRISGFGGHDIHVWPAAAITIVWLIGCANAFNLIDGVDGVASGVGLFATTTMLVAALIQQNLNLAVATAPLAGALLGFLRYNFNPASIYLGDSGSLTIGFVLGCFGVIWSQKSATVLGMTAPLLALAIPILDTGISIFRRFLRHQPIFGADRDHIHHRLLKRGLSPKAVALVLYGIAALGAGLSLLQSVLGNQMGGAVVLVFCAATWIGVSHLGYLEFGTARRMLFAGDFRRALDVQLRLQTLEQKLSSDKSFQECWGTIVDACRAFDFVEVKMQLPGMMFHERLQDSNGDLTWALQLQLPDHGLISFTRVHESTVLNVGVASFVDTVRKAMAAKCTEFQTLQNEPVMAAKALTV